jgi:hypothetical protein
MKHTLDLRHHKDSWYDAIVGGALILSLGFIVIYILPVMLQPTNCTYQSHVVTCE